MAKESILKTDKNLVFRETFGSEDLVRANGWVNSPYSGTIPTTFANGAMTFNNASNAMHKSINLKGTYSVRVRYASAFIGESSLPIVDFRDNGANSPTRTGLIYGNTAILLAPSSGTAYVNGVATTVLSSATKEIVISGMTIDTAVIILGKFSGSASYWDGNTWELFEIYKGTLTANEVKNLYENRQNREINNYSKQLVTNPDFLTDTSWTKESGWTISGGQALCDGTNGARLTQNIGMIATRQYKVSYKINVTSGSVSLLLGGNGAATVISTSTETSEIKVSGATAPETLYVISTNFVGSIDYVYVEQVAKEILRVDARNGVIANKYSGSTTGNELTTNGNFDSTANWNAEAGVTFTVTNGIATIIGSSTQGISQVSVVNPGDTYRITLKYKTAHNNCRVYAGGGAFSVLPVATDYTTYSVDLVAAGSATIYILPMSTGNTIYVDYISYKRVIPSVTPTAVSVVRSGNVFSLDFNGTTSKIDCGSYDTLVGDKTLVAWINPRNSGENQYGGVLDKDSYSCNVGPGYVRFTRNAYSTAITSTAGSVPYYKWTFLVITSTSTGITNFYINGVLNGSANQSGGTPSTSSNVITVGNRVNADRTFDGQISNVRIYDGILSTAEIAQLYQSEKDDYNL